VLVVDASVVAVGLVDDALAGRRVRKRLRGERLAAPDLIDLEVASTFRGRVRGGRLTAERARLALTDLLDLPLVRAPHAPLIARCWELRDNLTTYDAAYVALAELLQATLLTSDSRLAGAPGLRCDIEVLN
jgi:predicted nucleic acid-binding protein